MTLSKVEVGSNHQSERGKRYTAQDYQPAYLTRRTDSDTHNLIQNALRCKAGLAVPDSLYFSVFGLIWLRTFSMTRGSSVQAIRVGDQA